MKHRIAILLLLLVVVLVFLLPLEPSIQIILIASSIFVFSIFLLIGVTTMKWNYFLNSINSTGPKKICLTFDDGPHENTKTILAVLKKHSIKASFFVIGKNCKAKAEILNQLKEDGHIIGNHSYSHTNNLGWARQQKLEDEINQTNLIVQEITGVKPIFYRPPFGITNPNIARAIKSTNMKSVGWRIRSFGTVIKEPKKLIERTKSRINLGGQILLMHDTCEHTATALEEIIQDCHKKGIKFVNLNDIDFS